MKPSVAPPQTLALLAGTAGLGALLFQFGCQQPVPPAPPPPAKVAYNAQIQPILAENCFVCHGPDSSTRKASLRLDRAEFATAPHGKFDAAIMPGQPDKSPFVERITSTFEDERMPPLDSHKQLKPAEVALLTRWVSEGAVYQPHWSLLPPTRPAAPAAGAKWAKSPVDHFIAEKLAANGLRPSREENPARLLRRLTLDLTGLPPTATELVAFDRDHSPAAYARTVDRLLATDACAEQFARHWLDAVRYADTHGIHIDNYRTIWPYRDWVVGAFKQNLPFDQFTLEQMAGDLLPDATLDQKVASGYNRCLPTTSEGGAINAEYEAIYAKDRVETMSTVWLGLTTGCASCHDHKFDPVSTKDFYALTAFFRNNTMAAMDGNVSDPAPTLFVPTAADRPRSAALQTEIAAAQAALQARAAQADADFEAWLAAGPALAAFPVDRRVRMHEPFVAASGPDAVAGPFGPAIKINGLDRVLGPPVAMLHDGVESFGLFVRIAGQPSGSLLSCLQEDGSGSGWEIFLSDGKVGLTFVDGKSGLKASGKAKEALPPGQWCNVFLSFDMAVMRSRAIDLFVDGKHVAGSGDVNRFPNDLRPAVPLRLGARTTAAGTAGAALAGGEVWVQDLRRYDRGFQPSIWNEQEAAVSDKPGARVGATWTALATTAEKRTPQQQQLLREHYLTTADPASLALAASLDQLLAEDEALRRRGGVTLVMEEKKDSAPFAHVLTRGEYTQPAEKVAAATPGVLPPLPAGDPANRLGLAHWLVDAQNPLTARVTVNRVWQNLFGTGLVESAGDFGVTGARPSHPELLDWLAVEFRESGWNYRQLVHTLVMSATYRQSAVVTPRLLELDPDNRLLARGPRARLDAEQIRDQALAASGLLVPKLGGRPVQPYQPEGIWEDVAMKQSTTLYYHVGAGEDLYRRSFYTVLKRTAPPPAMDILNAPNREVSCVRRDRTNTPLQALVTLNDPIFVESSRQLAARALHSAPQFDARLDTVSLGLVGRVFSQAERAVVRRTLDDALATYRRDPTASQSLLSVGASPADPALPAPELAAWTIVASQVMNLDEALTK